MRILVTGGAGYVGSHTASHLIDAGHDVDVFVSKWLGDKLDGIKPFN